MDSNLKNFEKKIKVNERDMCKIIGFLKQKNDVYGDISIFKYYSYFF